MEVNDAFFLGTYSQGNSQRLRTLARPFDFLLNKFKKISILNLIIIYIILLETFLSNIDYYYSKIYQILILYSLYFILSIRKKTWGSSFFYYLFLIFFISNIII